MNESRGQVSQVILGKASRARFTSNCQAQVQIEGCAIPVLEGLECLRA